MAVDRDWPSMTSSFGIDMVVSEPAGQYGRVVQYDFGKFRTNGIFERTGSLAPPPEALLNTLTDVQGTQEREKLNMAAHLSQLATRLRAFACPSKITDIMPGAILVGFSGFMVRVSDLARATCGLQLTIISGLWKDCLEASDNSTQTNNDNKASDSYQFKDRR